jgi:surface protein
MIIGISNLIGNANQRKSKYGNLPSSESFIFTANTSLTSSGSSTSTQFRLPLVSNGTINFVVDWGDGTSNTITTFNQAEITHTYPSAGTYIISLTGTIRGFRFANGGDRLKILNIRNWGTFNMTNDQAFRGCTNLNATAKDAPIISTTSLSICFGGCPNFNGAIGNWDIKDVTNLNNMLDSMIASGGKFNQYIGNWNTSKVTTMVSMFARQHNFNQDISTKEVTVNGVTYIAWDTSNVLDMRSVFSNNPISGKFNQNIGNWNTSKVTTMSAMFQAQADFNQDISTKVVTVGGNTYTAWDTSNVTDMSFMLFGSTPRAIGTFNQNIGNWNTSKVTVINSIFNRQPLFNQDISTKTVTVGANTYTAWDTLNATNMSSMFFIPNGDTGSFNQNINNWNTIKVTNMTDLFSNQKAFNQLIDNWNVSLVTAFNGTTAPSGFMQGKTFEDYSSANYDALLIGWSSRPVQANRSINFGTIKYSSAAIAARAILTSAPNNWTIVDGGLE